MGNKEMISTFNGAFSMPATSAWPKGRVLVPSSKDLMTTAFLPAMRPWYAPLLSRTVGGKVPQYSTKPLVIKGLESTFHLHACYSNRMAAPGIHPRVPLYTLIQETSSTRL